MFALSTKNRAKTHFAGVALHADGTAVAVMQALPEGGVRLRTLDWEPGRPAASLPTLLKRHSLRGLPVTVSLAREHYAWLQLESPEVPKDEVCDALRWRIRDMVEFDVEDALLDYVELPAGRRAGAQSLLYVAAAPPLAITTLAGQITAAGGRLVAVDVPELSLRDLVANSTESPRVQAYLYLDPELAMVVICDQENLYLTRHINQEQLLDEDGQVNRMVLDSLLLEVQRSLDYFESQFALGGVEHLYLFPLDQIAREALMAAANSYLTIPVEDFPVVQIEDADKYEPAQVSRAMVAFGAAIREMPCVA